MLAMGCRLLEEWRMWMFLLLNLVLLVILLTSVHFSSSSYELQNGEDDEIERKIKKQSRLEDDNDACVYASNECYCELVKRMSVYGFEQEELERVELNQRVEAFIAMFRQHLVSNAK
ncbi:hypothetical protein Ancab_008516 [Ancistrocladus abbreviatus]